MTTAWLSGCGGGGEDSTVGFVTPPGSDPVPIVINSAAQIAQVSADDYDDNINGLITGATLKRWKDDWINERPAGITGKLVILQVTAGPGGSEYIAPNGLNVFTYLSPSSEWIQTRSNGVISTQSMVPDGASMDALLKKYNIDPHNDMIVAAMGTGSNSNAMGQGRVWYALRYWGVEARNLAVLSGGNQWLNGSSMAPADFSATASTAPNNGIATVKSLPSDNTALQATVQDMLSILPASDSNVLNDGAFIWDARSLGQYSAREKLEMGEDTDASTGGNQACATAYCDPVENPVNPMVSFQNNGSRQGHPWGTLQLQYTLMLDPAQGYAYRPKAVLESYLNGELDANGMGFVDATYQPVGAGNAYQDGDTIYAYCETTFRAMITGVASAVILGKPTRFYDGAMVEWNSLSYLQDATGNYILPIDSPWRTDLKSFFVAATDPSLVAQRQIDDPYAARANAIILADKAYKTAASSGGGSGGGGSLPPNPCGG
ncbi:MAG: sulfurtransferase [Gammaproteobacteria bacterium]